jgi:two-component system, oxyanion-binding sensor
VAELTAGHIAGFCAGAPWGDLAEETGAGRIMLGSSAIQPRHAEKCLALPVDWAAGRPDAAAALVRALQTAQRLCDLPERADPLAGLLASRLDLPRTATRAALAGGHGVEQIAFAAAARLNAADGLWFLREMRRWGWLEADLDHARLIAQIYRSEVHQSVVHQSSGDRSP